ncbi:MAG TPA: glycerol kinase GlpK [Anaerolineae bacterium]|nr:glycerol kinase GlpK [Anaerolineae bacterium]
MTTPSQRFILAIDEGTTNAKAVLVDQAGGVVKEASRPVSIAYPQPGWVEQDAWELWQAALAVAAQALDGVPATQLAALAITNQRESVLAWERATGQPLGPCITWQCKRSAPFCSELRQRGLTETIYRLTGLTIDPMFSAGKARWLLDTIPDGQRRAEDGAICLGTVDSWLLWHLTGGAVHACDVTNASRTQLFSLKTLAWDDDLLAMFGIPRVALPEVMLSSARYGETAALRGIPAGLPIGSLIGDSHAALYGHAGFQSGAIKATYGTGSSLMTPTAARVFSQKGLSSSIAWGYRQARYALEGNIYVTGAAVQWLADFLGLGGPDQVEVLAAQCRDTGGVYFVPALAGLGAPYWQDAARGLISGLTRGSTAAHMARATQESIAYQIRDVFETMQAEAGAPLQVLLVDGGATRNQALMQFQADILGVPVLRSLASDVSALGAAYLAGLTVGLWASEEELAALSRPQMRFEPAMADAQRERLYAGWQDAVDRVLRP